MGLIDNFLRYPVKYILAGSLFAGSMLFNQGATDKLEEMTANIQEFTKISQIEDALGWYCSPQFATLTKDRILNEMYRLRY